MELTKFYNEKIQRDVWMLTPQSYTLDMVSKGGWESEAKEDSAIKGSSCDGAKRRISVDWESSSGAKSSWRSAVANHKSSSRSHVRGLQDGSAVTRAPEAVIQASKPAQGVPLNHSQWWTEVWSWRRRKPNLDRLHRCFICTWLWGKPWLVRCPFRLISRFLEVWPTRFRDIVDSWSWAHWDHRGHGDGGNWRTRHLRLRAAYAMQDSQCLRVNGLSNTFLVSSMVADIGTKPLTAARFEFLKVCMGMGELESKSEVRLKKEKKEKKERRKRKIRTASWPTKSRSAWQKQLRSYGWSPWPRQLQSPKRRKRKKRKKHFLLKSFWSIPWSSSFSILAAQRFWDAAVRGVTFVRSVLWLNPEVSPWKLRRTKRRRLGGLPRRSA